MPATLKKPKPKLQVEFPENLSVIGELVRSQLDESKRLVPVVFSSEAPVLDSPYHDPVILIHEEGSIDFTPLRDAGSVLYNHDSNQVIGKPEGVRLDVAERKGRANIVFDTDAESERIFKKVVSGSIRGVSFRYEPKQGIRLKEGESWKSPGGKVFQGPNLIVTKWLPREISITPIPADPGVGVGRSFNLEDNVMKFPEWMKKLLVSRSLAKEDMGDEDLWKLWSEKGEELTRSASPPQEEETPPTETPPPATELRLGQRTVTALMDLEANARMPGAARKWIDGGYTIERARAEVMDHLLKTQPVTSSPPGKSANGDVTIVAEARDKCRTAMHNALLRRCSALVTSDSKVGDGSNKKLLAHDEKLCADIPYDLPLVEMARRYAFECGLRQAVNFTREEVFNSVILGNTSRAFQHSTSDFTELLENIGNKSLAAGFSEVPTTYQAWCGNISLPDFKTASRVKLSESEDFIITPELAPIPEGSVSDSKETYKLDTYSRSFGLSRQAFINDDLSGFSRIPQMYGAAARRTINKKVYDTLKTNAAMTEDSVALFHSTHTNVGAAVTAKVSQAALEEMLLLFRKKTAPKGKAILNLTPAVMVVPASAEAVARKETLSSLSALLNPAVTTNNILNNFSNLNVVVEPYLDGLANAAEWYAFCSQGMMESISVVSLNGKLEPTMVRQEGTRILGLEWLAYIDFGVAVLEWRSCFRSPGA